MNGAPTSWASRRAISVLPTPVGPIMMMFLGVTSLRSSGVSCCRRQRLRMATATAFLAASWPTMYRSSSATIFRGVRLSVIGVLSRAVPVGGVGAAKFFEDFGRAQADDLAITPNGNRPPEQCVLAEVLADGELDRARLFIQADILTHW